MTKLRKIEAISLRIVVILLLCATQVNGQALPYRLATATFSFIKFVRNGISNGPATAPNSVINIENETPATVSTTAEWSPGLTFTGSGWDTDDAVARTVHSYFTLRPITGNTVTSQLQLMQETSPFSGTYSDSHVFGNSGSLTMKASLNIGQTSNMGWSSNSLMASPTNGNIRLTNNAGTDFSLLQLGGTTSSFPALKRSSTIIQSRLADDSGFASLQGNSVLGSQFLDTNGDSVIVTSTATISSGFSTSAPSIEGQAMAFAITIGATPGITGTVNFNTTYQHVPSTSCTNTITANIVQAVPTTTTVVLNGVWVEGDIIRCITVGY